VDDMNRTYGDMLLKELHKLKGNPLMRSRSDSTGSRRLSSEVGHGDSEAVVTEPIIPKEPHSAEKVWGLFRKALNHAIPTDAKDNNSRQNSSS
jgi:hypothetical protein